MLNGVQGETQYLLRRQSGGLQTRRGGGGIPEAGDPGHLLGRGKSDSRSVGDDEGSYSHLQAVLKRFTYPRLKRADKGLALRYLGRTTGY
jgi:hypothetical protein